MTTDVPRPDEQSAAKTERASIPDPAQADEHSQDGPPPQAASSSRPTSAVNRGLFHKRPDAIGPAPVYFSVALGITFGASLGLLLDQLIIGIIFGALIGALYGMIRRANYRE